MRHLQKGMNRSTIEIKSLKDRIISSTENGTKNLINRLVFEKKRVFRVFSRYFTSLSLVCVKIAEIISNSTNK